MRKSFQYLVIASLAITACGKKTTQTKPEYKDITQTVFASGTLEPDDKYNLVAQSEGYLSELLFEEGDQVKAGQVLAKIDNPTSRINTSGAEELLQIAEENASVSGPALIQAKQNVQLARKKVAQDSTQFERYNRLLATNSISKVEWENAKMALDNSRSNLENAIEAVRSIQSQTSQGKVSQRIQRDLAQSNQAFTQLTAVKAGRVYKKLKQPGDYVRKGDVVAVIGNAGLLFAKLSVDESNIRKVQLGQKVVIQLNVDKSKTYEATISELYPSFDEATQSFFCRADFANNPDFGVSGTQLQANILIGKRTHVLVIPRTYLIYGNKVNVDGKGEVAVETGFVSGEWVEIIKGISASETIVTDQVK